MSEKYAVKELFQSPETLGTVIHAIMQEKYGEGVYDWDVMSSFMEVQDDFDVEMSPAVINRWGAMQTLMVNDAFFTRVDAFLAICNTLASGNPFFDIFNPVTLEEAAWGITEASLNREMLPFSYPIKQYIKLLLPGDGYVNDYPEVLDLVLEDAEPAEIREEIRSLRQNPNNDVIETYIDEQLRDMISQFNKVPSLAHIDNILMAGDPEKVVEDL